MNTYRHDSLESVIIVHFLCHIIVCPKEGNTWILKSINILRVINHKDQSYPAIKQIPRSLSYFTNKSSILHTTVSYGQPLRQRIFLEQTEKISSTEASNQTQDIQSLTASPIRVLLFISLHLTYLLYVCFGLLKKLNSVLLIAKVVLKKEMK